jgi:hypothetical protein
LNSRGAGGVSAAIAVAIAWFVRNRKFEPFVLSINPASPSASNAQGYALAQLSVVTTSRGQREADAAVATQIGGR